MPKNYRNYESKKYTFEDAKSENKIRIKRLNKSKDKKARALWHKLKRCRKGRRCDSPACAKCAFIFRRRALEQVNSLMAKNRKHFGKREDCFATLVPPDALMGYKALPQFNIARRHNSLSQQLNRSKLKNIFAIGITEGAYKGKLGKISIHQHVIVFCKKPSDFEYFRKYYTDNNQEVRPIRIDTIEPGTLLKVASYCLKFTTYGTDKNGFGKRRPPEHEEIALLIFLDRHTFKQLMFLKGLRFEGGRFKLLKK